MPMNPQTEASKQNPIGQFMASIFGTGPPPPPRPEIPSIREEVEPARQHAVEAMEEAEEGAYRQQQDIQAGALDIGERAEEQVAEAGSAIDEIRAQLDEREEQFQETLGSVQQGLQTLPKDTALAFDFAHRKFSGALSDALSDVEGARETAMADVYTGQAQAMQAAVQGTHGQVNAQVAEINANPDLTQAQKAQMTSQVKMQGAMQLAPAIGATQLQFNTLAANTNTAFGQILGQVTTAGLAAEGQLLGAGAAATAQAHATVSALGAELLKVEQTADTEYAAAQSQLVGLKSQVEMLGNQFAAELLPAQATPFVDHSGSALLDLQSLADIIKSDISVSLTEYGLDINLMAAQASQGSPLENLIGLVGAFRG